MPPPYAASVRRYTWHRTGGLKIPGVQLRNGAQSIFIPAQQLITFSDFCVDAFEAYEETRNREEAG